MHATDDAHPDAVPADEASGNSPVPPEANQRDQDERKGEGIEQESVQSAQQPDESESEVGADASAEEWLQVEAGLPLSLGAFVQRQVAFTAALAAAAGVFPAAVHVTSISDDGPTTAAGPSDSAVVVRADIRGLASGGGVAAVRRLTRAAVNARLTARGLPPLTELDTWIAAPSAVVDAEAGPLPAPLASPAVEEATPPASASATVPPTEGAGSAPSDAAATADTAPSPPEIAPLAEEAAGQR